MNTKYAQGERLPDVEERLESALNEMSAYYKTNSLKPNPSKTQVCAFHLRNKEAKKIANIFGGSTLEHTDCPKYLGAVLDRSLTYRNQCV